MQPRHWRSQWHTTNTIADTLDFAGRADREQSATSSLAKPSAMGRVTPGRATTSYSSLTRPSICTQFTWSPVFSSMTANPQRGSTPSAFRRSSSARPLNVFSWRGRESPIMA
jgi:hypothetical protein